jgi:hypothetical protein
MGRGCVSLVAACAVLLLVVCAPVGAQDRPGDRTMYEVPLPGGLRAALATLDDHAAPDRSQFLLETIRRFYSTAVIGPTDPRLATLYSLTTKLDQAAGDAESDLLPLPLPPALWVDVVFGGRATAGTLVSSILQSRNASLLYCALLSLDQPTREWLMGRRDLLAFLAAKRTAPFLVAAPGLRVRNGRMELPGGEPARPVWLALAAAESDAPEEFVQRLLTVREGRLAYFIGALSQLSQDEISFALRLDLPDPAARVTAGRDLYRVFEHVATGWNIDAAPFWRPPLDPALLISDLGTDEHGRPRLPGTRAFWSTVLELPMDKARPEGPVDFGWLSGRVFDKLSRVRAPEYDRVLFASRHAEWFPPRSDDVMNAVRGAGRFPALVATLERAGVTNPSVFAAATRRAIALDRIEDSSHATRALEQFQGILALITRASIRGSVSLDTLSEMVSSLSAVELSKDGDYEGRLVQWLQRLAEGKQGDELEDRLLQILAGSSAGARFVEWEGTRYRVDLPNAESTRLAHLLGEQRRPLISAACALIQIAQELTAPGLTSTVLQATPARLAAVDETAGGDDEDTRRYHDLVTKLRKAATKGRLDEATGVASELRLLADGLLARGVVELAYAVALGQPGATVISVSEAASRHEFGTKGRPASLAWELPDSGVADGAWHVRGSLLGLDARLAAFSLVRVSSKPPPRPPSLDDLDRRSFSEAVSLVQPRALVDSEQHTIAEALTRGRVRLGSVRSPSDIDSLADEIRLGAARRTLLAWSILNEPERVPASLSFTELLWLGMDHTERTPLLDAWGAPAESRLGCLCLKLMDRRPWEILAGRWNTGMLASGFPDLNLRVAELLQELQMPAILLGPVLAAATLDFLDNANARDADDRRGLVEFVQRLKRERLEEYLALLTTDGPLVPVGEIATGLGRLR